MSLLFARNMRLNLNVTFRLSRAQLSMSTTTYSFTQSHSNRYFSTPTSAQATAQNTKLFNKILIANRGEIACRIMRTCKKLGIKTVAIYSEPDADAVHVKTADESVCVGPAASGLSYLSIPNILTACKLTGAEAVHPGYGFLSENKHFQIALKENGIKFIGPETNAITIMGDKISSKTAAKAAGVSIIPGILSRVDKAEEIVKIAREIGYPVMVKASGGGGGKGMRIARNDAEALEGYKISQQEAINAFGNDSMFIEKFIEEPRHIEFQILGDRFGNAVYVNERECTVQRRNQKVIEEAPSTFLTPELRREMGEQAVALAKAVGYESAGTVEFLVDKHRKFYYLEMNTRLQVEHPVTEQISGLDLVEQMIRVAAGQRLSFTQKDIKINGWALEARVYAEDPLKGFLPSIGKLQRYVEPVGPGIRVDTGVREGSQISVHYDPMIAKIITYGPDRAAAFANMRTALDSLVVRGVTHNVNFLRSLMDHSRVISGDFTTNFIPEEYPQGYKGLVLTPVQKEELTVAALIVHARSLFNQISPSSSSSSSSSFNPSSYLETQLKDITVSLSDDSYRVSVVPNITENGQRLTVKIQNESDATAPASAAPTSARTYVVESSYQRGDLFYTAVVDGASYTLQVVAVNEGLSQYRIMKSGTSFNVSVLTPGERALFPFMPVTQVLDTSKMILSPMPGVVFSISVKEGDEVLPGAEVAVVEAMKMQNALRAVNPGKVKQVHVKKGQTVQGDQLLIEFF